MIQLASDPNASRTGWQPVTVEAKGQPLEARRGRTGHAWPFISRHGEKPAGQAPLKSQPGDSGS